MHSQGLPWNAEEGEKRRLGRIVSVVCPIFVVAMLYIAWVQLPEQSREEVEKLPPQLARLVKKIEPPKPVVKPEEPKIEPPKLEKKPEPKPEPEKVAEKPKPVEKKPEPNVAEKPKVKVPPKPQEVELAREKAKSSGVLAMSNQLAALSTMASNIKLDTPKTVTATPIAAKKTDKLASQARTVASGGVSGAKLSQETQKLDIASRAATKVAETEQVVADVQAEQAAAAKQASSSQRSSEDLRKTIDANKSAIYSIYNRALRKKPSLRGAITPELVLAESGQVTSCKVVQSTLNDPDLESKICNRLLLVNFGPKAGSEQQVFRPQLDLIPG